jgi:hypothetical protein
LYPLLGYCEQCCNKHQRTGVFIASWCTFLQFCP